MKLLLIVIVLLANLFSSATALGDGKGEPARKAERERQKRIYNSRPRRIDEPLRAENVSDEEIREIQAATITVFPGAIANISGVTAGCPCEEGPTCDSQVWILAHRDSRYDGLMLSRISNKWVVGPLQKWWFEYDSLDKELRERRSEKPADFWESFVENREKRLRLREAFPICIDETDTTGQIQVRQ